MRQCRKTLQESYKIVLRKTINKPEQSKLKCQTKKSLEKKVEEWLMQFHSNQATRAIIRKINQNSILDIYGIARSETHHSKFLAWLFNPNESHNTGELALRKLLNIAVRRGIEQNNQSEDFLRVKKKSTHLGFPFNNQCKQRTSSDRILC